MTAAFVSFEHFNEQVQVVKALGVVSCVLLHY
jgi:hypothetical protein